MIVALLVVALIVYAYIAAAFTMHSCGERLSDIPIAALVIAVWPIGLPFAYMFGVIRLHIKWRKYRGGLYLRKTFDAAAIDEHLAKYGKPIMPPKVSP